MHLLQLPLSIYRAKQSRRYSRHWTPDIKLRIFILNKITLVGREIHQIHRGTVLEEKVDLPWRGPGCIYLAE